MKGCDRLLIDSAGCDRSECGLWNGNLPAKSNTAGFPHYRTQGKACKDFAVVGLLQEAQGCLREVAYKPVGPGDNRTRIERKLIRLGENGRIDSFAACRINLKAILLESHSGYFQYFHVHYDFRFCLIDLPAPVFPRQ